MNVNLNKFNAKQRLWYGFLIASATKADGEVNQSEIEFLISALHFLEPKQKFEIQNYLKTNTTLPGIEKVPEGINKKELANIFTDLIWVVVSDGKLTRDEKQFLTKAAEWFDFSKEDMEKLLQWGEQMLLAEKYRRKVIDTI